jgi:gliding motility-associated lipoprotein GldH
MPFLKKRFTILLLLAGFCFSFDSCTTLDLYEKDVTVPYHSWASSFKPEFNFTIKDSTARYQLYFVIRHTAKYNYNNIWINLYSIPPGDTLRHVRFELPLATNEKGWLASGMDDIYEHRIPLTNPQTLKAGTYTFMLEQIMREDPLENVLNVGLRLEKKP